MPQQPSPLQTLLLWTLIGHGGGAYQSNLGRKVNARDRDALKRAGLISVEKRGNKGLWVEVSEKGWAWASQNLGAPLPTTAQAGAVLQAWLARLQSYMRANNVPLAEIITVPPAAAPGQGNGYAALRDRVRGAYRTLTGGVLNKRVFLRDLRGKLADVDRIALDRTLLRMTREEEVSLIELDNRREITDADREAAIPIGGEPRHIVWIRS